MEIGALKEGQIQVRYGGYGETVDSIELLLLKKAKMKLDMNEDNTIQLTVSDTDFDNQNLSGALSYDTVNALIKQLIRMRNQLEKQIKLEEGV